MIEDKFAHAVALEIEWARGNQLIVFKHRKMLRLPPRARGHTASFLHTRQPIPFEKRRAVSYESVPLVWRHFVHTLEYFDLQHGSGHYWQALKEMQEQARRWVHIRILTNEEPSGA